jgi:signal transduction histidine kinase
MSEPTAKGFGGGSRFSAIVLSIGFLVLIGVAGINALLVRSARDQNAEVAHTVQVQRQASRVLNMLIDAETGQRGYLLTGKAPYRQRYIIGRDQTPIALDSLAKLTSDNQEQQQAIRDMRPLVDAKLAEMKDTVTLADGGRTDAAIAIVRTDRGKLVMDRLRVLIEQIQAEESRLLTIRRDAVERGAQGLLLLSVTGLIFAALLAAGAILSILRYARKTEEANAEVRHLNEGLEDIVADRTADLREANEEIQRFAYIVSHDLRSPLVNVMGFTSELEAAGEQARDLLAKAEAQAPDAVTKDHRLAVSEDLPEALGFIRTSTAKMDRLINAILKLSREGRRTLAPERIDMTALLNDIAAGLYQQTEAAGAAIAVEPLPPLTGDRLALDQVFGNLVENAVKYLDPARPGRIRVSGKSLGDMAEITVEDNGRGIDKADQERVFDLFRRAGAQDRPGEGIGLAHVRALVRRLGGTIALASEIGRGSRFIVTLPVQLKGTVGE